MCLLSLITLVGCPTDGGGNGGEDDITYTVSVDGDENTTSTRMDFEFSDDVLSLSSNNIQIGSPAVVSLTQLQPTDPKHWSFSLNVFHGGNTTVKINQSGIESGTKNVFIGKSDLDDDPRSGICEEIVEVTLTFPEQGDWTTEPEPIPITPKFEGVKNQNEIVRILIKDDQGRYGISSDIITPIEENPSVEHGSFNIRFEVPNYNKDVILFYSNPWHPNLPRPASIAVKLLFNYKWSKDSVGNF